MTRRLLGLVVIAAIGAALLTNIAFQRKQIERKLAERIGGVDRYVDIGVTLHTVVADPDGQAFLEGKPRLRILHTKHFGGIVDTKAQPARVIGPSRAPRVWYCSEDQEAVVLHSDPAKLGQLVYGSEGAGKTRALAMWHYFRWLEHIGERREGGQTAPTVTRLAFIREEMHLLYGPTWFRYVSSQERFLMCDGTRIQLVSTYRQSKAQGSPIQGYNWSWCGRDEAQDQIDVHEDIEARGRSAKNVQYSQLATATAKDDSDWRTLRDALLASGHWANRTLLGTRSPFVGAAHWERMKSTMSPREYDRRVLAKDVGVELAVYYGWERARNLTARPAISTDVTPSVLAPYQSYSRPGSRFSVICAHDPGNIFNTTLVLRLVMFGAVPTWMVAGELQTKQTSAREHARKLRAYLSETFGVERESGPKAAVFCDPHGKGEAQTDYQTVYMAFQREGLDVFSPAPTTGRIKRAARVAMVNRLLGDANGVARLVVACDDRRNPVAPRLVEAFETLEKQPGDDNPEGSQRKDVDDKTHAPAALAYGLWVFEQEAFTDTTQKVALDAAARMRV